jgi:hypothetical protein
MIKNICNYSAIILLTLVMTAGAVSANTHRFGPVKVEDKPFSFFNKFLTSKTPQAYSVTVKEGQETNVKIKSKEGVAVKLYLPDGSVKEYRGEKFLDFTFHAAGEYVVELNSSEIAQYTLKVLTK